MWHWTLPNGNDSFEHICRNGSLSNSRQLSVYSRWESRVVCEYMIGWNEDGQDSDDLYDYYYYYYYIRPWGGINSDAILEWMNEWMYVLVQCWFLPSYDGSSKCSSRFIVAEKNCLTDHDRSIHPPQERVPRPLDSVNGRRRRRHWRPRRPSPISHCIGIVIMFGEESINAHDCLAYSCDLELTQTIFHVRALDLTWHVMLDEPLVVMAHDLLPHPPSTLLFTDESVYKTENALYCQITSANLFFLTSNVLPRVKSFQKVGLADWLAGLRLG